MKRDEIPKARRGCPRWLIWALALGFAVAAFILIFSLAWFLTPGRKHVTNVCTSEACITAANFLQSNMDLSADPCQDFFTFACGGFVNRTSGSNGIWDLSHQYVNSVAQNLDAVVRNDTLAKSADPEMNRMYNAVRQMVKSCEARPGTQEQANLGNSLMQSLVNSTSLEYIMVQFVISDLPYPIRLLHVEDIKSTDSLMGLVSELMAIVQARSSGFSAFVFESSKLQSSYSKQEIEELRNYSQTHLGSDIKSTVEQIWQAQNDPRVLHRYADGGKVGRNFAGSIDELQNKTKAGFSWQVFIEQLNPGRSSSKTVVALVNYRGFLALLEQLITEQSNSVKPTWDLLRLWFAGSLKSATAEAGNNCVAKVQHAMQPVVYQMYKSAYLKDNFSLIDSIFKEVADAMKQNVMEQSWMQDKSKDAINDKISRIKRVISYYEIPQQEMKSIFNHSLNMLSSAKGYIDVGIVMKDARFRLRMWAFTSETPLHNAFCALKDPFEFNAYYFTMLNNVFLHAGYILTDIYNKDYPRYLLHSGIGSVIGHEIGHAFDQTNIYIDESGLTDPFDDKSKDAYRSRTDCLIKSYSKMPIAPNQANVNGTRTVEENFCDIVGINAAFRAYAAFRDKDQRSGNSNQLLPGPLGSRLTIDQLFFVHAVQFDCGVVPETQLSWTDVHSPPMPRVIGTVKHSKEFSKVFQCKPGDKMHLSDTDKCLFW